ncbi:hypothetical protein IAQ61_007350 [Plenodomus lingam]|uniref:Uncharacterized protein n=1 Tax=Leptosphaeria maculans (strain JN3 / isolate v23.1.3 / race Av1-4-5-6-7-8) TaxID=985895 RepID=E5A0U1_LEPMJ|nr:hypothetical protein LEMA_P103680.1 [Plenodomus lingam JN3]KAH9868043.1 hypothetical protein IAQ61_007350 [Plenodomus lingam]CBX97237.1 hypothetical protein LEMA_P103680.1 [Plenodomus lingam JN3]
MAAQTVTICKFVGTISLGIATGVSATLSTLALPALLALPTAVNARTSLTYLASSSSTLSSYLRHMTTFTLFSAYLLSPRQARHPYLLYTSIFAFASGPGVDYAVTLSQGSSEQRQVLDLEAQGDNVNGEQVRQAVERRQSTERLKTVLAGLTFAMQVVGLWGDGA